MDPSFGVIINERCSLLVVGLKACFQCYLVVVWSFDQWLTSYLKQGERAKGHIRNYIHNQTCKRTLLTWSKRNLVMVRSSSYIQVNIQFDSMRIRVIGKIFVFSLKCWQKTWGENFVLKCWSPRTLNSANHCNLQAWAIPCLLIKLSFGIKIIWLLNVYIINGIRYIIIYDVNRKLTRIWDLGFTQTFMMGEWIAPTHTN